MALGVAASLVGVYSPRTVQVVVTGLTPGEAYTVVGSWSGGTWPVRAGAGTAEDTQIVLPDLFAPLNRPVTYTVAHAGVEVSTAPVTVTYPGGGVLQSLAGDVSVPLDVKDNGAPRDPVLRQSLYRVPGRTRPLAVFDVAGGETGALRVNTDGADTTVLRALLSSGAPLLLRTDGAQADLDAVSYLLVTRASSSLLVGTLRRWELDYELLDDPEPDSVAGLPTWDDFDESYAGLTWAGFDAEFSSLTWADFDRVDWATRAEA